MHILALAALDFSLEVFFRVAEREFGACWVAAFQSDCARVAGLVQGGAEVTGHVVKADPQAGRNVGLELDLGEVISGISVYLSAGGPVVLVKEGFDARLNVNDAFLRSVD